MTVAGAGEREGVAVQRLQRSLRGTAGLRRLFYSASLVFPSVAALLLTFLALFPILFAPTEKLAATLASMVGAGLSFASVSFSAARAYAEHRSHAVRLKTAGSMLLRFAIAMAVALALGSTRERLAAGPAAVLVLDVPLRALTAVVTVAAIGMAFLGFRTLVLLLGPELEEEAARSLRELLASPAAGPATAAAGPAAEPPPSPQATGGAGALPCERSGP